MGIQRFLSHFIFNFQLNRHFQIPLAHTRFVHQVDNKRFEGIHDPILALCLFLDFLPGRLLAVQPVQNQ